ncbi:MAG: sigma-70 family RNA polymerase sigma factor [Gammaproteobacteria bacterium]|nr:sigma-70 family RNA polymerase sigma factor [Gammaproteobacteria bacterium]
MKKVNFFDRSELQKLHRYGCALSKNPDDAYDLLQYAIEKYLQKPNSKKHSNDIAYVQTIMRNRYIDEYRKSTRFTEESYDDNSPVAMDETSLEDICIAQLDLKIIWEKLDTLEREILYYWAVEGKTAQEISNQTDTPRGTVLSRLFRIRRKFAIETANAQLARGYTT